MPFRHDASIVVLIVETLAKQKGSIPLMGTTANSLLREQTPEQIATALDRLRSYHVLVTLWCWATLSDLTGQALVLLSEELETEASANATAARRLADRVAELGGSVAANPTELMTRARVEHVDLPEDPSHIGSVLGYALAQIQQILPVYDETVRGLLDADPIGYRLVVDLYSALATREDEIEAALAGGSR